MKSRIFPTSDKPSAFGAEGSGGLLNLPNLPLSELGSPSNTNSESSKSTVFRIGTNQTHPLRDCFQISISIVLQQYENKVDFQGKGSGVVLKSLLNLLKGSAVLSNHKRALSAF